MADPYAGLPKQLRILKRLTDHLQLTPGFTDMTIVRGLGEISAKFASDSASVLSILESPQPVTGPAAGRAQAIRNENWVLLVQGWPVDDKAHPSDPAYLMKAAVEFQLAQIVKEDDKNGTLRTDEAYLLNREIRDMTIGQGVVRPPQKGDSRLAMFYIPLTIGLVTDSLNPYA